AGVGAAVGRRAAPRGDLLVDPRARSVDARVVLELVLRPVAVGVARGRARDDVVADERAARVAVIGERGADLDHDGGSRRALHDLGARALLLVLVLAVFGVRAVADRGARRAVGGSAALRVWRRGHAVERRGEVNEADVEGRVGAAAR